MLFAQRLLTPGPTAIPDRVRLAMAAPMIHHRKPEFKNLVVQLFCLYPVPVVLKREYLRRR